MPYRVDLTEASADAFDRLVELGALDVERSEDGRLAALMPDRLAPDQLARALGIDEVRVSAATGRDAGSVWILSPRRIHVGGLRIIPAEDAAEPGALRLLDAPAFGTGLHPTTALCIEALEEAVAATAPEAVLDVGTGSGVLALGALLMGVPRALGIDTDHEALRVAAENARRNGVAHRLQLAPGTPAVVTGAWPLIVANVLAAPLIEMAPALVRRVASRGRLVLSGIPSSVQPDVEAAYLRLGMQRLGAESRAGWIAVSLQASW